jgi:hypothetical protein
MTYINNSESFTNMFQDAVLEFVFSSRHEIACFKVAEGFHPPPPPYRAAVSQEHCVASFDTLQLLSCLHSPGLRSLCCDVVRFC